MSRSDLLHWLAAALVAMTFACDDNGGGGGKKGPGQGGPSAEKDAIAVKAVTAVAAPISQTYATSTTLVAEQQATIIARTTGVIERLLVEEGDTVRAGQTVAQLESAEQAITLARAQLTRDARVREYERQQQLNAQDLTSTVELEQSRSAAEDAEQAFKLANLEMERTTIRAPFSGVVMRRHLDVGASVSSGTAVYDIADVDPLLAEVRIPERHVATLSTGQEARMVADSSGAVVTGKIQRIAPFVDPTSGTVKVTVAAHNVATLRPGAFVKVDLVTDTHPEAILVPRAALVAEGRRWYVFEVGEDGQTVQRHSVGVGYEEGERVELLPGDDGTLAVAAGDRVVTAGAPALTDGAVVEIVEDAGEGTQSPAAVGSP